MRGNGSAGRQFAEALVAGAIALSHYGKVERLTKTHAATTAEDVTDADRAAEAVLDGLEINQMPWCDHVRRGLRRRSKRAAGVTGLLLQNRKAAVGAAIATTPAE